ncbi:MAG: putative Ig domain-containing protein, partial [Alistipes sp.]|nr:putative Ig domain-containing protein [Alistipes sp.]
NYFFVKIEAVGESAPIYPSAAEMNETDRYDVVDGKKVSNVVKLGKLCKTNEVVIIEHEGIFVRVELHDNGETSSFVQVGINNEIKTQHTYGVEKAEYKVTLTIPSEDRFAYGDYELTQEFDVMDCCPDYGYNSYYNQENAPIISVLNDKVAADVAATGVENTFIVKGHIVDGDWKVQELFSEAFDIVNNEMIFEYWHKWDFAKKSHITNVVELGYSWVDDHYVSDIKENGKRVKHWAGDAAKPSTAYANMITPVNPHTTNNDQHLFVDNEFITVDQYLVMEATMTKNWYIKTMNLTQWLVNGEHCGQTYNVVFYNPFYAVVNKEPIKIYGNTPDYEAVQNRLHQYPTAQMVTIKDIYDDLTLATADKSAVFTVLENNYGVDQGEVVYVEFAWDERYEALKAKAIDDAGLKDIEEKLTLDASTGVITWNNNGSALSGNYEVGVVAKIAVKRPEAGLENLCEFVIPTDIEVLLAAERYPIQ